MIVQLHAIRAEKHLKPLREDAALDKIAHARAQDMCSHNYYAHTTSRVKWTDFFKHAHYDYSMAGENIDHSDSSSGTIYMSDWENSPEHYSNMEGEYQRTGNGNVLCQHFQGQTHQYIVVNEFATPYVETLPRAMPPITLPPEANHGGSFPVSLVLVLVLVVCAGVAGFIKWQRDNWRR